MPRFTQPHPGLGLDWSNPINDGLVGYWPFLEAGGDTVRDYSGYGRDGTLTNIDPATNWRLGLRSNAVLFATTTQKIVCGSVTLNQQMTVSGWAMAATTKASQAIAAGENNLIQFESGTSLSVWAGGLTAPNKVTISFSYAVDEVFHYAIVEDGTLITAYKNGVEVSQGSATTNANPQTGAWYIGNWASDARHFGGDIGAMSLHDRVLAPSEITQLYADWWPFFRRPSTSVFVPAAPSGTLPPLLEGGVLSGGFQTLGGGL